MADKPSDSGEQSMLACPAWGQFRSDDPATIYLRRHGVRISGPCKLPGGHEGDHRLDNPPQSAREITHG